MSEPKPNEVAAYLLGGLLLGWLAYAGHEIWLVHQRAGWEMEDRAPWCAVDQGANTLRCRYFSKDHCQIGAILAEYRGPNGPLCVPKPE